MPHQALTRYLTAALLALFGCSQPGSTPSGPSGGAANKTATPALARQPIVVDAGTVIVATIDQSISSKTNNPGDHFDASLAAPVMVGGKQVIPSGAKASGTVTVAKSAGRFKGNAALGVTLNSITVNGRPYQIQTTAVIEASKGRGKRTAIGAGGGAAAEQSSERLQEVARARLSAPLRAPARAQRALSSPANGISRSQPRQSSTLSWLSLLRSGKSDEQLFNQGHILFGAGKVMAVGRHGAADPGSVDQCAGDRQRGSELIQADQPERFDHRFAR